MFMRIQNENGTILGLVMVYMVVFTLSGIVFLRMTDRLQTDNVEITHVMKNRLVVESAINIALWRMNNGFDSLATFNDGVVQSEYNMDSLSLVVTTNRWNQSYSVNLDIELNHIFNNMFYSTVPIDTSNPNITILSDNLSMQVADSMPTLDTAYYYNNAVEIYPSGAVFNDTLAEGIHFVESGQTELKNNTYLRGTIVAMGKLKIVGQNVFITAGTDSAGNYLPALIVADTLTETSITNVTIEGAIISYGHFEIKSGLITGPFIGNELEVKNSLVIDDQGSDKYYTYYAGFTDVDTTAAVKSIRSGSWR